MEEFFELSALDDGIYLMIDEPRSFTEVVRYAVAEEKMYHRPVRFPDGRGNIIYFLTDNFEKTFDILNIKNRPFVLPPTYRRVFYPSLAHGSFFGRRYRLNLTKQRAERLGIIKSKSKLLAYPTRKIAEGDKSNIIFIVSDLLNLLMPIAAKFSIRRVMLEFYKEFDKVLHQFTPEWIEGDKPDPNSGNRVLFFDVNSFAFKNGAPLKDNKTNPLFLLYLAFFRTRNLTLLDVDRDMIVCSKNMFIKFNPTRLTAEKFNKFRAGLFRVMKINLDKYIQDLSEEDRREVETTSEDLEVQASIEKVSAVRTQYNSPAIKAALSSSLDKAVEKKSTQRVGTEKIIQQTQREFRSGISQKEKLTMFKQLSGKYEPLATDTDIDLPTEAENRKQRQELFKAVGSDYKSLTDEGYEDDYDDEAAEESEEELDEILISDPEVAEEIVDEIEGLVQPMDDIQTAPVNSPRDHKLREKQKKIVVQNSTIEEILAREASNIPIQSVDKSHVMTTTNANMKTITFNNFEKTYLEELYVKDVVACFDCLKDKSTPLYISSIKVVDSSTTADLKETWTVKLRDETGTIHTMTVDLPKFHQHRFMRLGGNKYIVLKQNFYNPLVKDTPDRVVVTTNRKVWVARSSTKSLPQIQKIFSLISKLKKKGDSEIFLPGDASKVNKRYISSLEFDELGSSIFRYKSGKCTLYFNRDYIRDNLLTDFQGDIKADEFLIGYENKIPILIHENKGTDRLGRSIVEIITANLSEENQKILKSVKPGKQSMFAEATLAGSNLPMGVVLVIWVGLTNLLDRLAIAWEFHKDVKRVPAGNKWDYLKFQDGLLIYEPQTHAQLILNGLNKLNTEKFNFQDMNTERGYIDFLQYVTGNRSFHVELRNYHEFMMDPISVEVCRDYFLPTEADLLLIEAVKLLCDNSHESRASDKSCRVRSIEIVPAILYQAIQSEYKSYVRKGRTGHMSLDKSVVLKTLMTEVKTIEPYSTLNPPTEVGKMNTISTKGFSGSNRDRAYNQEKRSYDPTSVGKLAMSTGSDASVGINRDLVAEPTVTNARGYRQFIPPEDFDTLNDVNVFSPVELLTPGTVAVDEPVRVAIAGRQTRHLVPVKDASPSLVSNGYDEAVQFHLSNDFVVNAEENGEVVEVDAKTGLIVVKYTSGKHHAFSINPDIVNNSGGGFYLCNTLTPTVKLGDKFKKDAVLAYHAQYFNYSELNGLRYAIGPLAKIAYLSTYNTYEDAGFCTVDLADRLKTAVVYREDAPLLKTTNVSYMAKIGDIINVGDFLLKYELGYDAANINNFMNQLSQEEHKLTVSEEAKTNVKAEHAGRIVDIEVISLYHPDNLSPTLGKIVSQYWARGNNKKKLLSKYDDSSNTLKAGYLITDNTSPHVNRYNRIEQYRDKDVLIKFFIEHEDVVGVGDKIAQYGANKNIISEIIPPGYEPYSEHMPEEPISIITSAGVISRRSTTGVLSVSMGMKVMIELKRAIAARIK